VVPFGLFWVTQGRFYYLAPAYPALIAAGAWLAERPSAGLPSRRQKRERGLLYGSLAGVGLVMIALMLPLAPVNSAWFKLATGVNGEVNEKFGWTELVAATAAVRDALPLEEQGQAGVLTGNYGEAGAIALYGPAYHLPQPISGINSYWLRGYGDTPPQTLIVLGLRREDAEHFFANCTLAGHVTNPYQIKNEESVYHPDIFVCRNLRQSWPIFWKSFKYFG
jgi:hypothetical protein